MSENVLITGANRGIGLEFVRFYGARDARVFACCRQPESAPALAELAAASEGRIQIQPLDVTNPRHLANLKAVLHDTPIDILLSNAGIYGQTDACFGNTDVDTWLETFRVNTIAPVKLAEALVDQVAMSERRVMGFLSSKMGSIDDNGSGGSYVYRTSKTALNMAIKSMAVDLAPRGIAVAALHPGWVLTDMGGPNAEIDTKTSVAGMAQVLDGLTTETSGRFYEYDGSIIPW